MTIALNKQLPLGNTTGTAGHWLVKSILHNTNNDFVVIKLQGFESGQARRAGAEPYPRQFDYKFIVQNTDENGSVTNNYNKWKNFKLDKLQVVDGKIMNGSVKVGNGTVIRDRHLEKAKVLQFFETVPDFADATDDSD